MAQLSLAPRKPGEQQCPEATLTSSPRPQHSSSSDSAELSRPHAGAHLTSLGGRGRAYTVQKRRRPREVGTVSSFG